MYTAIEKEVLAMETKRRDALVALDMDALDCLFTDDYVHVHSNTLEHNKSEILAHIKKKKAFVDIKRENLRVRVIGDMAVLYGKITNVLRREQEIFEMRGWVTQVLRKEDENWRFTNFQFTKETL